jgi:hypothetical protein
MYTLEGLLFLINNLFAGITVEAFTGVTTNSSPTVTNLSSTTGLLVGQNIIGLGIPAGTSIIAIDTGTSTLTLSQNATATSTTGSPTHLWSFGTVGQTLGLFVHLLVGPVPVQNTTVWSSLTEANYDGYAPIEVLEPGVVNTPDQSHVVFSAQCMTFAPADYIVPNTITGIAWTYTLPGATGPTLLAVEPFNQPVPLTGVGDILRLIPILDFATNQLNTNASPILA